MDLSQYKDSVTFVASGSDIVSSGLGMAFNETINNGIVRGVEEGNNLTQTILDNSSGIFRLFSFWIIFQSGKSKCTILKGVNPSQLYTTDPRQYGGSATTMYPHCLRVMQLHSELLSTPNCEKDKPFSLQSHHNFSETCFFGHPLITLPGGNVVSLTISMGAVSYTHLTLPTKA